MSSRELQKRLRQIDEMQNDIGQSSSAYIRNDLYNKTRKSVLGGRRIPKRHNVSMKSSRKISGRALTGGIRRRKMTGSAMGGIRKHKVSIKGCALTGGKRHKRGGLVEDYDYSDYDMMDIGAGLTDYSIFVSQNFSKIRKELADNYNVSVKDVLSKKVFELLGKKWRELKANNSLQIDNYKQEQSRYAKNYMPGELSGKIRKISKNKELKRIEDNIDKYNLKLEELLNIVPRTKKEETSLKQKIKRVHVQLQKYGRELESL